MRYTLIAIAALFACISQGNAATTADHTCKHRDGTEFACSVGVFNRNVHIKQCGSDWKASTERANKSQTWPAFWSACSKRLNASR